MRIRYLLPLLAALALAGCNPQPQAKGPSPKATAAIPPAPSAEPSASAANCPPQPKLVCPPAGAGKRKGAQTVSAHRTGRHAHGRRYAHQGRRHAPSARYAAVDHSDLVGGPPTYRRYSGPQGWEESREAYAEDRAHEDHMMRHRHHGWRDQEPEERYGREDRAYPRPPPPPPPPPPPEVRRYGYSEHSAESERRERSRYWSQRSYESSSYSESRRSSESVRRDCPCGPSTGAAGFDGDGYLTWPGKVPAR